MKLYFTNPKTYLGEQKNKELSLGGYPSISPIPNSQLNNLFPNISKYSKEEEAVECIGLVLKNEFDNDVANLSFYFNLPENSDAKYEIAAVLLTQNTKNEFLMELLPNLKSLPYNAEFHEADGEINKVSLGDLTAGCFLGLWIKKSITNSVKTDDELWDEFTDESYVETEKEEVGLKFDYDIVETSSSSSV